MLHPGYVASLSSCVLCTDCVGGWVSHSGGGSGLDELLGVMFGSLLAVRIDSICTNIQTRYTAKKHNVSQQRRVEGWHAESGC
jgi:uncharacterized membrane protein required for colicin V production